MVERHTSPGLRIHGELEKDDLSTADSVALYNALTGSSHTLGDGERLFISHVHATNRDDGTGVVLKLFFDADASGDADAGELVAVLAVGAGETVSLSFLPDAMPIGGAQIALKAIASAAAPLSIIVEGFIRKDITHPDPVGE